MEFAIRNELQQPNAIKVRKDEATSIGIAGERKVEVPRGTASEQQEDTTSATEQRSSSELIQPSSSAEATSANEVRTQKEDLDGNSEVEPEKAPQTSIKAIAKPNNADDRAPELSEDKASDALGSHDDKTQGQKVSLLSQMKQDANELWAALIVLLEFRRIRNGKTKVEKLCAREQAHFERVCELVVEKEMVVNPCTKLPFNCLIELRRLNETQQKRKKTQIEHDECVKELEQAMKAFEAAISKRTTFVLEDSDEGVQPEMAAEVRNSISDATMLVEKTQQKLSLLEKRLRGSEEGERNDSELPLRMAETVLVEQQVLNGNKVPENESQNEQPKTADDPTSYAALPEDGVLEHQREGSQHVESRRAERESNIRRRRRRDRHSHPYSRTREDRALRHRVNGIRNRRRPRSNYEYDRYGDASRSVQNDKDFVEFKREQVMKARRALSDVRKQREDVRRFYYENLVAFLQGRAEDEREAAQVEFDQMHFLEQQRMTTGEFILEEDKEMFNKQAKELRAFHADEITSDFSDWTGDGYDDSGFDPLCPVWKLEEARITTWVESERDRLGINDGHLILMKDGDWDVEQPAFDPSSKTILPFGDGFDPHDEDLFSGKWRRMIDDYQHKQNRLRSLPKLGTLSWWQEVSGI